MSILIKGMDMPKGCIECPMQFGGWCYVSPAEIDERVASTVSEAREQGKPNWCPLIEIPTPHGRLIDASELIKSYMRGTKTGIDDFYDTIDIIDNAPTIVEAEIMEKARIDQYGYIPLENDNILEYTIQAGSETVGYKNGENQF